MRDEKLTKNRVKTERVRQIEFMTENTVLK